MSCRCLVAPWPRRRLPPSPCRAVTPPPSHPAQPSRRPARPPAALRCPPTAPPHHTPPLRHSSPANIPHALPSDRRRPRPHSPPPPDLRLCRVRAGHDWSDHWLTGVPGVRVASVTTSTGRTRRTVFLSRRGAIRRRGDSTGARRRMRRKMVGLHREPGGSSRQRRAGLATNGSAAGPKGAAGFSRARARTCTQSACSACFLMLTAEDVLQLSSRLRLFPEPPNLETLDSHAPRIGCAQGVSADLF
ncbi:hypothetical protein ABH935_009622 [Catenulispora sp. GAS73]